MLAELAELLVVDHITVDSCTPDYIVYRESGLDKIRITAGYRATKFEEKH